MPIIIPATTLIRYLVQGLSVTLLPVSAFAVEPAVSLTLPTTAARLGPLAELSQQGTAPMDKATSRPWEIWSLAAIGGLGAMKWWRKGFDSHWTTTREGWFGKSTYAGGVDKLSHTYSLYLGTRFLARSIYRADTPDRSSMLKQAAGIGLAAALAAEVFDAHSKEGWGFSYEDLISGAIGVAMAAWMEASPEWDERLAFRLLYRPESISEWNPIDRYERQVYILALKPGGFVSSRSPWRFVEILIGYGATGFNGRRARSTHDIVGRQRSLYVGVGVDVSRLWSVIRPEPEHSSGLAQLTRFVQVPGTALLAKRSR